VARAGNVCTGGGGDKTNGGNDGEQFLAGHVELLGCGGGRSTLQPRMLDLEK
jgi:hypothetical protein